MSPAIPDAWRLLYLATSQSGYRIGKKVVLTTKEPWQALIEVLGCDSGLCTSLKLAGFVDDAIVTELAASLRLNSWLTELDLSGT